MQDKIGNIYEIVSSIIAIIGGILIIVYKKKFLELQKKYWSRRKDFLSQKMLQNLESRSDSTSYVLFTIIAILLIAGAIYNLTTLL